MDTELAHLYLVRHGETLWSLSGQHTGRSDIPLTPRGQHNARRLGRRLRQIPFAHVFTSPLKRARDTAELAGFGDRARVEADLAEVDYGEYEGLRSEDIRRGRPGWDLFVDGSPGGESVAEISTRADRLIERLRALGPGNLLLFSHRHFLQFLAVRWIGLPAYEARHFTLATASLSMLSYYRTLSEPVVERWNDSCHLDP